MLEILLLGVIHQYQWDCDFTPPLQPDMRTAYLDQRVRYGRWVRDHVQNFSPDLIFDEMNLPESEEDRLRDTGVLWVYMDIPEDVRMKYGLTANRGLPGCEWLPEIDEPRENYWQFVVERISAACKLSRVMILCGLAHLDSFGNKLRQSGHQVQAVNLRNEPWVNEDWCIRKSGA